MLRVIFAVDNLNVGGTELNALRTATRLHMHEAEVMVLALQPDGPLAAAYEAAGMQVHPFRIRSLAGPATLRRQAEVFAFLRRARPHVFHAHDKYSNVFGLPVARAARVPVVIGSRRWNRSDDGLGLAVANRVSYSFADVVLFNSERLQEMVGRRELIPRRKRRVVPNFLEPEAFLAPRDEVLEGWRRELSLDRDVPVVGTVANLRPVKDHATLLQAAHLLVQAGLDFYLVLVGAGDQTRLAAQVKELSLTDVVRFAGPRPARPSFHYLFSISALTSISEGFSNSVLEAMAAGRPVVATRVGGLPDAVRDGETGILIPPRSPHACATALQRLLTDPDKRERMGQRGRTVAAREFSENEVVLRLLNVYASILQRRHPASTAHGRD